MNDRDSDCKFSKVLVLIQADVLLPIEAPGEEINVTKVIHRPGNHAIPQFYINQSLSELNSSNLFPSSSDYHCGKRDLDGSYYPNDIALILLDWEATTSNYVRPICLYHPQQGDLSHHTQLFSSGQCSDYFSSLTQFDSPPGPHIRLNILHIFTPRRLG